MKTIVWIGAVVCAAAGLARADVLFPRDLEPSTSAVRRIDAGQSTAISTPAEPARLQLAPPVVPATAPGSAASAPAGTVPGLDIMGEAEYRELTQPAMRTTALWRVMGFGLWRGFANLTMWPAEIPRGFTYEFSSDREWYEALGTSWLAGFGGGLSRMSAGMADIITLGYFGDTRLARGYPDFVWQGDWLSRETLEPPTIHTADERVERGTPRPTGTPRRIVQPGTATATTRTSATSVRTAAPATPPPPAAQAADPTLPGGAPRAPR